jgi:hypothetical protein
MDKDRIAMATGAGTALTRVAMESVAEHMLRGTLVPILLSRMTWPKAA